MPEIYKLIKPDSGEVPPAEPMHSYEPTASKTDTADGPVLEDLIDLSESSASQYENILNKRRLRQFQDKYTGELLHIIREQDFEYGFGSSADLFVRELMDQNTAIAKEWINNIFLDQFQDSRVLVGLLQVISHLEYLEIYPQGPTMALAALSHADPEIRECGIRAFENWGTTHSLNVLRSVKCHEGWLQEYVDQVISDLEDELG